MKNYEIRRMVTGLDTYTELRVAMVIAVDHFDWGTNSKVFLNEKAFMAWVYGLSKQYSIDPVWMKQAITFLQEAGFLSVTKAGAETRVMTLQEPTNTEETLTKFNKQMEEAGTQPWKSR